VTPQAAYSVSIDVRPVPLSLEKLPVRDLRPANPRHRSDDNQTRPDSQPATQWPLMQLADLQSLVCVGVPRLLDSLDPAMASAFLQDLRGIPVDAGPCLF
jgi:hypothetical protein